MAILTTPRCILRILTQNDAEALIPILGSDKVMQYSMTGAMDLSTIRTTIDDWISLNNTYGFCPWAVIHNDKLIGYAGLDVRKIDETDKVQITFRLAENYWNQGFATEISESILDYAINKIKLPEVVAIIDPDNMASVRTLNKIGLRFKKKIIYSGLSLHLYNINATSSKC